MTKDDRILDLKKYIGRKKDFVEATSIICSNTDIIGAAFGGSGLAFSGLGMAFADERILAIGGTCAAFGLAIYIASKIVKKLADKKYNQLDGLYNELTEIDDELAMNK